MTAAKKKKNERVDFRVSHEDKSKIIRAVSFLNVSLSEFVMNRIMPDVDRTLAQEEKIRLDKQAWEGFLQLLENPKPASVSLKSAMQKYRESQDL